MSQQHPIGDPPTVLGVVQPPVGFPINAFSIDTHGTKPPRSEVLLEAERLINGDRNLSYGKPTQNFENIADVWTVQLRHILKDDERITPSQVAQLMASLKLVRMIASPRKDNWIDLAGYAGCGYECDVEAGNTE